MSTHFSEFCGTTLFGFRIPFLLIFNDFFEHFFVELSKISFRNKRLSGNSVATYHNAVKSFYQFIAKRKFPEDFASVQQWLDTIDNPRSYNLKLQAIKEYLLERFKDEPPEKQLEVRNKLDSLKRIKIDTAIKKTKFLSHKQIERLADRSSDITAAFVLALFWTGCRISELLSIKCKDCKGKNPVRIRIVGKGRKEREVYLPKDVYTLILEVCKGQTYLFEKANKKIKNIRYTREHVTRMIKKEAQNILGLDVDISAHTFRHSKAMFLLDDRKLPPQKVSKALGHAKTSTTVDFYLHGIPDAEEQGIRIYKR